MFLSFTLKTTSLSVLSLAWESFSPFLVQLENKDTALAPEKPDSGCALLPTSQLGGLEQVTEAFWVQTLR